MASGREYTIRTSGVATTVQTDLAEITPADDKPVDIVGLEISQTSDFGDAQDEILLWEIIRGFTTSGSAGSAPTPAPLDDIDTAAGFTAEMNNTTVANTGTTKTLHSGAFNVRAGVQMWWPQGLEPGASQANTTIVIRLAAPVDSLTLNCTVYVRER